MTEENIFESSAPAISPQDFDDLEHVMGQPLPDAFKQHYLRYNGGAPTNTLVPGDAKWEPTEVAMFYSVKYPLPGQDSTSEILSHYQAMRAKKVIPDYFLPFAWDPGGNLFGIELGTDRIVYYPTDMWDSTPDEAQNYKKVARTVESSFSEFFQILEPNPDADW